MKITGGRVEQVECRKLEGNQFTGINMNIRTDNLKEVKGGLEVHYASEIEYNDNFASMKILGVLFLEVEDKEKKQIVEEWKKDQRLPIPIAEEVLAAINYTSNTIGTLMAFTINVTAPINIQRPRIMPMPADKLPGKKAG